MMKAVQISECGGPEVLQYVDVPLPARKPGQVGGSVQPRRRRRLVGQPAAPACVGGAGGACSGGAAAAAAPARLRRCGCLAVESAGRGTCPLSTPCLPALHAQVLIQSVSIGVNPVDLVSGGRFEPPGLGDRCSWQL